MNKPKSKGYKILITWDGEKGEEAKFNLKFTPDPLNLNTNIRDHIVLLANAFDQGIKQLVSVLQPIEQPTEEELKNFEYDFSKHKEGTFALYNYKKAVMEEIAAVVGSTLSDTFHDVLYVQGVQEKIFEELRKNRQENKNDEEEIKGVMN